MKYRNLYGDAWFLPPLKPYKANNTLNIFW